MNLKPTSWANGLLLEDMHARKIKNIKVVCKFTAEYLFLSNILIQIPVLDQFISSSEFNPQSKD